MAPRIAILGGSIVVSGRSVVRPAKVEPSQRATRLECKVYVGGGSAGQYTEALVTIEKVPRDIDGIRLHVY